MEPTRVKEEEKIAVVGLITRSSWTGQLGIRFIARGEPESVSFGHGNGIAFNFENSKEWCLRADSVVDFYDCLTVALNDPFLRYAGTTDDKQEYAKKRSGHDRVAQREINRRRNGVRLNVGLGIKMRVWLRAETQNGGNVVRFKAGMGANSPINPSCASEGGRTLASSGFIGSNPIALILTPNVALSRSRSRVSAEAVG